MRIETLSALLESKDLPGTPEELAILGQRIDELIRLNGKQWVIDHRQQLIREWEYIVAQAIIQPT